MCIAQTWPSPVQIEELEEKLLDQTQEVERLRSELVSVCVCVCAA